jgi:diguanylate cyclase (GGDEF)-like protein
MTSSFNNNDVVRRTLIRTGLSVVASMATTLLIALALFGTDPNKTITVGHATIVMLIIGTVCSALLCAVMSYKSSVALQRLAQVRAELWEISRTDQLTGLLNRRGFIEAADLALAKAKREKMSAVALMCDVDRFKSLNDRFGHDFGDAVLVRLGNLLRAQSETTDMIVGRHGGEEFAALLLGKSAAEAMQTAEAIRRACAAEEVSYEGASSRITVSIGVAPCEQAPSLDVLLRDADLALYQAKDAGRDRVMAATVQGKPIAA